MNIKYSNKLNLLGIESLTKIENNIFFGLLHKLENKKDMLNISLSEIKSIVGITKKNNNFVKEIIFTMAEKLSRISMREESSDEITRFFSVFELLEVPNKEPMIRAKLSNPFLHIVNDVENEFTSINFDKYLKFASKYTQTIYRYLRQWQGTGKYFVTIEDFKKNLGIPDSYEMCEINRLILKKALKEFQALKIFPNLTIKKVRSHARGKRITKIEFHFPAGSGSDFDKLQKESNNLPTTEAQAEANVNRQKLLDNQKAKQEIKQHNIAALAAGCNALKVDEPIEERENRIKKEVQRTNMSTIMKKYHGRWFTYNNTSYKIDNFEYNADGKLVLFIRLEDNTPARYMHEFESINHFENYVKDYLI